MPYRLICATVLQVALCAGMTVGAWAQPHAHATQTRCDTLSVNPPLFRLEFEVSNAGTINELYSIVLSPLEVSPPDTCRIDACESPADWDCFTIGGPGSALWGALVAGLPPDQSLGGFRMTAHSPTCCYTVGYHAGGELEPYWEETICFECTPPVPALNQTWGRLKAVYR